MAPPVKIRTPPVRPPAAAKDKPADDKSKSEVVDRKIDVPLGQRRATLPEKVTEPQHEPPTPKKLPAELPPPGEESARVKITDPFVKTPAKPDTPKASPPERQTIPQTAKPGKITPPVPPVMAQPAPAAIPGPALPDNGLGRDTETPVSPVITEARGKKLRIDFFGTDLSFRYDPYIDKQLRQPIDNDKIGNYWKSMAGTDFKPLVTQVAQFRNSLQLNDWGYFLLLNELAENIVSSGRENDKNLFVWFMMVKSGYETKIGYREDQIHLLVPSDNRLFGLYYFTIKNRRYYALSTTHRQKGLGKIYTYNGTYPGSENSLQFTLPKYPNIASRPGTRELKFNYKGFDYNIRVDFNENAIPYFEYYPQNEAVIYTKAPLPPWLETSLLAQLRPLIADKPEREAVNLLLRFTQKAFKYKTDQQQFNREKFMFPEETIFYPYSDCEDRSIFFSYLVRKLVGLDVILLNYPNHIATAVQLSVPVGDQVVVGGKRYTVCDPTFINADLGKTMPKYKGLTPEVVFL